MQNYVLVLGNIYNKVRVQAIVDGAARHGLKALFYRGTEGIKSLGDMCKNHTILYGIAVGMRGSDAVARGYLSALGINVLILDLGYFSRAKGPQDKLGYNQLGLNRLCWVPDFDVPDDRLRAHKINFEPFDRSTDKPALVLGQVPGDTQHNLSPAELKAWLLQQVGQSLACGFKVNYRPHPKATKFLAVYKRTLFNNVYLNTPLEENLREASYVITYNSTAGLSALAMGKRVVCAETAHYYGLVSKESIYRHFCRLAYAQWTCEELRNGLALDFMGSIDKTFTNYGSPYSAAS